MMRRLAKDALVLAAALPLATVGALAWPGMASGDPAVAGYVPAQYRVVNLGGLGGAGSGEAMAVNDRGEVVGYSTARNGYIHPFLWRRA